MDGARLPEVPRSDTAFRLVGMTVVDGLGGEPLTDGEVAVADGRITYVGPRREHDLDDGVATVELAGRTVLPGFIDCHVHLSISLEDDRERTAAKFASERTVDTAITMRRTLAAGITTARDLGGLTPGYRTSVAQGNLLGPRLHLAIAALSPTGGHTDSHLPNGRATGLGEMNEVVSPIIDTDDDVRRTVRTLVRTGADVIKVCTTGGVSSPSDTPEDIGVPERHVAMIVEETARRQHQPVAAHAQGSAGILEALRGGVTSVEHGYQIDREGIDLMLERDRFLVPTLSSALRVPDPAVVPDYLYRKKTVWSAIARDHVAAAFAAGVKVALGTDSGVCPHGRNLTELGHMVELGLTPMQAIVAGTRNAADLLGLGGHVGTLATGRQADLVLTAADPLADITALSDPDSIAVVVQGGRVVKDDPGWLPFATTTTPLG